MIPDTELAFAAGIMEGEGTVRISALGKRNKGQLFVSMVNTNVDLVRFMQERWPGYCKPAQGDDGSRSNRAVRGERSDARTDRPCPLVAGTQIGALAAARRGTCARVVLLSYARMYEINRRGVLV